MSIPVLGVPVLNRGDLLLRLFDSIGNFPINKIVIINNGNDLSVSKSINTIIDRYGKDKCDIIEPIDTEGEFDPIEDRTKRVNWGCAKSWNYILKNYMHDYVWIAANDVAFRPGQIEKIIEHQEKDRQENLGKLGTISYANVGYGFWIMNKTHLDRCGYFDENFYPAYYEDMDYNYRMKIINENCQKGIISENVSMRNIPEINMIHGNPDSKIDRNNIDYESCTIHSEKRMKDCNDITFWANFRYFVRKWGGDRNKEIYKIPFNDIKNKLSDWSIDLNHRKEVDIWNKAIFDKG